MEQFDYHRMGRSPSVFDYTKLRWMNGEYLKAMDPDAFFVQAEPWLKKAITKDLDLRKISEMVRTRIEIWPDIPDMVSFFEELPDYDVELYRHKKMKTNPETALTVLREVLPVLEAQESWTNDDLFAALKTFIQEKATRTAMSCGPCGLQCQERASLLPVPLRSSRSWAKRSPSPGSVSPSICFPDQTPWAP